LRPYRDASGADFGEQQSDTPAFHSVSQGLCMTMWVYAPG